MREKLLESSGRSGLWLRSVAGIAATALVALATASSATASVTIGQIGTPDAADCSSGDWSQPTVSSGNPYVVPATGTLTSWSHIAKSGPNQKLKVKVFRPVAGLTYTVVGQDVSRDLASGVPNTFATSIAVKAGDVLGLTTLAGAPGCAFGPPGETYYYSAGDQSDGAQVTFTAFASTSGQRLNVSAVIEPTNTFTLGSTTRNKKKGTATLTVNLPNPGELTAFGKGVSAAGAAVISKAVTAGTASLRIKAKGKKKRKLNDTGKVKLNAAITFTPTGGDPNTQSRKVKLKKKL
jgi:hypothetical protein